MVAAAGPAPGTAILELAGITITRVAHAALIASVRQRLVDRQRGDRAVPLAIGSVNLDHVHHFGTPAGTAQPKIRLDGAVEWQLLVDGSPISRRAHRLTGEPWPRLAGSDLLPDLLDLAAATGARVGFLGGTEPTALALRAALRAQWPALAPAGFWTPPREVLDDPVAAAALADEIRAADVELLVVGLGKPRQELWTDTFGARAGASVYTMFGAAADFLAGTSRRAPGWMRGAGIEWMFRLATEPRRLWRRYLLQGPGALRAIRQVPLTSSAAAEPDRAS